MEDDQFKPLWNMLAALGGGLLLMTWAVSIMLRPIPVERRDASPGFGWSWDFAYERALQEPYLTADSPINRAPSASDQLILALGEPVSVAGLAMTYRGLTESGRFRLDTAILALDAEYPYPREFSVDDARRGFTLFDERFVLLSAGPAVLRLRHVPQ